MNPLPSTSAIPRWVEQNSSSGSGSSASMDDQVVAYVENQTPRSLSRPSDIRTSNSYDGQDENFSIVALNLLSRREYFGMTPADAICATLVTPRERSSFLEALALRKMYSRHHHHHLSPSTASLIQTVEESFGKELARIVELEAGGSNVCEIAMATTAVPSHGRNKVFGGTSNQQQHYHQGIFQPHPTPQQRCSEVQHNSCGVAASGEPQRAFFFPDSLFGATKSKVTTRNIDWKLAEAIEQINVLQLNGMDVSPNAMGTSLSSSSAIHEPPCSGTIATSMSLSG